MGGMQESPDEFIYGRLRWPRALDHAVDRNIESDGGHRLGYVVGSDGLEQDGRQMRRLPDRARLGDPGHKLEELSRADNRVGNPRGLDQVFLGQLRTKVSHLDEA